MKALIVDDEQHVRDAIRMLIDWDRYGIRKLYEAPEGAVAMDVIQKERPEIVFTDMRMPIKDGVELLQWLHEHYPDCKVIVISGHDDFDYVRHTVKYGGIDYLLKPIVVEELNEALSKAIESWNIENEARRMQQMRNIEINQIKPVYWDKIFSSLVQQESFYPDLQMEIEQEFRIKGSLEQARIAIMSTDTMPRLIMNKFASHLDLLFFSLANIVNEYLLEDRIGYAFRYWNSLEELVIVSWGAHDLFLERVHRINEGVRLTLGGALDIGIGNMRPFPKGLQESYKEAQTALKQRNLLQTTGRIHHVGQQGTPRITALPFSKHETDFRAALFSGQEGQIDAAVAGWITALKRFEHITVEQLELWNQEYAMFKSRCFSEFMPDEPKDASVNVAVQEHDALIIPLDDEGKLSFELLYEEVKRDLLKLSGLLTKLCQRERSIIYEIVDYIEQHYQEDISLQHIAEQFYLSREYISRRFKQEMKENISDYITRLRIEKAKLLLHNPQLKINEIAELVGYRDEKYFSKVFKKIVGRSPNQYRKSKQ